MPDNAPEIAAAVEAAHRQARPLEIVGGRTKRFYGRTPKGEPLNTTDHSGIVLYEPTELVVTARAGTPLAELEATLAEQGQMLPFEPPYFGDGATLGGTIACGLSGPARFYRGAARDFVLGVGCVSGTGQTMSFGGRVMKNVAGYDISRLMCGALGTLGVLLEVSLKVLPKPNHQLTVLQSADEITALDAMNRWARRPLPLSATCYDGEFLYVRLSGARSSVEQARQEIGGEVLDSDARFWHELREHRHEFFQTSGPLWRLSLPSNAPPLSLGTQLIEWGGAQRWLKSDAPASEIRRAVAEHGGHANLFRGGQRDSEIFHPQPEAAMRLTRRVKAAFDPQGILNPGRLYPGL